MSVGTELLLAVACAALCGGCDEGYPEIVVVNRLGDTVLARQLSFSGCLWNETLANGAASSPGSCLPGADQIHFQKFDAASYCRSQAEDRSIDGLCPCDAAAAGAAPSPSDTGLVNLTPMWFNYQTSAKHTVDYGDSRRIELTENTIEQDFSIPGPYGH